MITEMIAELNRAMYEGEISFDCVHNILNQLSKLTGLEYDILNRRVVFKDCYGRLSDAYTFYTCI